MKCVEEGGGTPLRSSSTIVVGSFELLNLSGRAQSACLGVDDYCALGVGSEVCVLVNDDSSIVPLTRCLGCGCYWVYVV